MTFKYIVTQFFSNYEKENVYIFKILFDQFLYHNYSIKKKYEFIKNTLKNIFLSDETKDKYIDIFCKIQKIYFSFLKFKYAYFRKYCKFFVNKDLYGMELDKYNKQVICIFHNNGNYLFHIRDLNKIIYNNLTNGHNMFPEPLPIKNPYNNMFFNKSTLYNIYFFLKYNTTFKIDLYEKYFYENFNLCLFLQKYEYILKEYVIINYLKDSSVDTLSSIIKLMLIEYNKLKFKYRINIHDKFPIEKKLQIFKDYLPYYFKSIYSYTSVNKYNNYNLLIKKLYKFAKFNPTFGKLKYRLTKKYVFNKKSAIYVKTKYFDETHIHFINEESESFPNSHESSVALNTLNLSNNDMYSRISDLIDIMDNNNVNSTIERFRRSINSDSDESSIDDLYNELDLEPIQALGEDFDEEDIVDFFGENSSASNNDDNNNDINDNNDSEINSN